jgi:hypothetical protein
MRAKKIGIFPCADRPPPTPYGQADAKKSPGPSLACQLGCIRAPGQMHKAETNRACTTRQARLLSQAPDSELRVRPRSIAWYETAQPPAQANYGRDSIVIPMVSLVETTAQVSRETGSDSQESPRKVLRRQTALPHLRTARIFKAYKTQKQGP